jgi:hypothetical protein
MPSVPVQPTILKHIAIMKKEFAQVAPWVHII